MKVFRPKWTTVGLICATTIAAAGSRTSAETIRIVSPPSAADAEGNSSVTPNRNSVRVQHLIPAEEFAELPLTHRYVVGLNFRADRTQTQSVDYTWPHERMWMSTTSLDSLTTEFDANHGPDKKLVFDGAPLYPLPGTGPAGGPRDIADGQRLQSPFFYDPSMGNLLIEQQDFDRDYPVPATIDVLSAPSGRFLINDPGADAATGTFLPSFAVLQIEFAVGPNDVDPTLPGDFNQNGEMDAPDIDDLTGQSAAGSHNAVYDLDGDALVNNADVDHWIENLYNSWMGDANLDRQFNSSDLVAVLASGTYEVDVDSFWTSGDFNGDGRTNSSDLVAALAGGGYELGPRAAVAAVPEPTAAVLLVSSLLGLVFRYSRSR